MIKSIELDNWKTHKHSEIEFRKGVNVIIGIMGSGKSSIMDAISYALFGTFPDLASKRISTSNLIMDRPSKENYAIVSLTFDVDGDTYKVTRRINADSPSEAKLEKNGKHLQTQPERVTEMVCDLLKINYDTFSRAIYSQQNQLNYFLELPKGDRKRSIDEMLGLDNFSVAEENATSLANTIRNLIEGEQQALANINISEFVEQSKKLVLDRSRSVEEQEKLRLQYDSLNAEIAKLTKRLSDAKQLNSQKIKLNDEIQNIKSRISTLKSEISKIDSLKINENIASEYAKAIQSLNVLEKEIETLKSRERASTKALSDAESTLKLASNEVKEKNALLEELKGKDLQLMESNLEGTLKEIESLKEQSISTKSMLQESKKWLEELNQHISKCPICERDLTESMKESLKEKRAAGIKEFESKINSFSALISEKEVQSKKLKAEFDALSKKKDRLAEYSNTEAKYEEAQKKVESLSKIANDDRMKSDTKSKEYKSMKDASEKLAMDVDKIKRKVSYIDEITKDQKMLDEKTKIYDSYNIDDKLIYSLQDEFTKISSQMSEVKSKLESSKKYVESIDLQIAEKQKAIDSFARIEEKIRSRRETLSNINKFKSALVDTETVLRMKLVNSINSIMDAIWPQLYPYGDYPNIRIEAKKDDYALQTNVSQDGSWTSIDAIASGGEKSIACLSMRIALAMVIVPNLKWLILDEPTHNIDSNGIDKLINVLGTNLPKIVEQVFIITHDESMKQINEAAIFQLDRDKSNNSPTVISTQ